MIRQKKFMSGGGIDHRLMKWVNGVLTHVMPKKVGGTVRYYPLPYKRPLNVNNNTNWMDRGTVKSGWEVPVKKALQAEAFTQPSGYDRNVVLSAINSSMGSGVSRPRKMVRRLL